MAYIIGFIVMLPILEMIKRVIHRKHDSIGKRPWGP